MPATRAIFDLDGTLADTMPVHFRAWQDMGARHGVVFPIDRFYSLGGVPTVTIARLLVAEQGLAVDPARLASEKEAAFLARFDEIGPIAPVVALARRHAADAPVAVATGSRREVAERTLATIGLRDLFEVVVAAEDTARHKPDPDVFLEAARRLGAAPADCAVYEDTDLGLEAARRAGMTPIDVRTILRG